MYARGIKDRTLTLGVSGQLWEGSLVMVDSETESLWSHLLGEAMQGPLTGTVLEVIPSIMTDWKTWRKHHPDSTVVLMTRTSSHYVRAVHQEGGGLMLGYVQGKEVRAWDFFTLSEKVAINDRVGEKAVLAGYDRDSGTAVLYERNLDGRILTFAREDGGVRDRETGSHWDIVTGMSTAGPLKGKQLARLPGMISIGHVWNAFHPESKFGSEERGPQKQEPSSP